MENALNLESKISEANFVRLDVWKTGLFSISNNALVSDLFSFGTSAANSQLWLAIIRARLGRLRRRECRL